MLDLLPKTVSHAISRAFMKQKSVRHSSNEAEILPTEDKDDRKFYLRGALLALFPDFLMQRDFLSVSKSPFDHDEATLVQRLQTT